MAETLEIDVHLIDGSVRRFRQTDSSARAAALSRLHPERVFDGAHMVFGQAGQIVTLRQSAVLRIELRGEIPADWSPGPGIDSIEAVDGAAFVAALSAVEPDQLPKTGERYEVQAEVRDIGGGKVFAKVIGRVLPEAVRVHRLERLMESGALLVRTPKGALLINLKNALSMSVRPSLTIPGTAILADERMEC